MAAVTATKVSVTVGGNKRRVLAQLPAMANGDTYVIPHIVNPDSVLISVSDTCLTADKTTFSLSGNTVTFNVVGTARAHHLVAEGV